MAQTDRLSRREKDVLKLLMEGKGNKWIASSLDISVRTVEFHLKNIYTKFQVSSRVELILKLGHAPGDIEFAKLGDSTVDGGGKRAENRDGRDPRMDWGTTFRDAVSMTGKEPGMEKLLKTKHVLVGVSTSLFAGLLWVAGLMRTSSLSLVELKTWAIPFAIVVVTIGLSIGLVGKRSGSTLPRIFLSALLGTGLSPFGVIPLMVVLVLPLGQLAAELGWIDPATMSSYVAAAAAMTAMMAIWLIAGMTTGILLLFVSIKKPAELDIQVQA